MAGIIEFLSSLGIWIIALILWDALWKAVALWRAGRNNQIIWFAAIFILNTVGILPIVYLLFFQKNRR